MNRISNDIKTGEFARVYLLYGSEGYMRRLALKQLLEALGCGEGDMNFSVFRERPVPEEEVISICETLPFFADRRVVLVDDSGLFKEKGGPLADYIPNIPDTAVLIFSETEADKRGKLYKAAAAFGGAVEFSQLKEDDLSDWAVRKLIGNGKRIRKSVMELFLEGALDDVGYIDCELEKLIAYTGEREVITKEDVKAICSPVPENRVFDMVSAMAENRRDDALKIYRDLRALKEPPMHILYLISRQYDRLLRIAELDKEGLGRDRIADILKIKPYAVKKSLPTARRYGVSGLKKVLEKTVSAEQDVKEGNLTDVLAVELMMMNEPAV